MPFAYGMALDLPGLHVLSKLTRSGADTGFFHGDFEPLLWETGFFAFYTYTMELTTDKEYIHLAGRDFLPTYRSVVIVSGETLHHALAYDGQTKKCIDPASGLEIDVLEKTILHTATLIPRQELYKWTKIPSGLNYPKGLASKIYNEEIKEALIS